MIIMLEERLATGLPIVMIAEDLPLKTAARVPGSRTLGVGILEKSPRGPHVNSEDSGAHGAEPRVHGTSVEDDERIGIGGDEVFDEECAGGVKDCLVVLSTRWTIKELQGKVTKVLLQTRAVDLHRNPPSPDQSRRDPISDPERRPWRAMPGPREGRGQQESGLRCRRVGNQGSSGLPLGLSSHYPSASAH